MITNPNAVVITGIAAEDVRKTIVTTIVAKKIAVVAAAIIAEVIVQIIAMTRLMTHNSHATIAGKNQNAVRKSNAMTAVEITAAVMANANMVVAGMKNVVVTSIIRSWDHVTKDLSKSYSAPVIPVLILTNTRIYPWKRRDRMFHQTSHRSKMFS